MKIDVNHSNIDIDLKIIMGFNKIKTLTNNFKDIINALKDSQLVELSQDRSKIRKKNINKEFIK
jgi:La-related protein 7